MSNTEEIVLNENEIICLLTDKKVKVSEKENTLQYMIQMMSEEYNFALEDMERDFSLKYTDEEDKKRTAKITLAIFEPNKAHDGDHLERAIVIAKDSKVKPTDKNAGVMASLEGILTYSSCEFGCWTNGEDLHFLHSEMDEYTQVDFQEISDFPAFGQSLDDLVQGGEKAAPRKPANESLVKTFKRCHDYIYGNEGKKKTAFWELLNLIFCKLYDEKRRFTNPDVSYRRKFWVGVTEMNTPEGQAKVAARIKSLFEELKESNTFSDVFDGNEQITLSDRGLTYVASEIAKYSFLDATVDVKGTAYETIVSNTLKQEAGQFFTPRNIIKCMVEMLDPNQNTRVLDPACGSGGFLVMVLDHVRHKMTQDLYPELSGAKLEAKYNSPEINDLVREYAEKMIFGFDFDPDLRKAARMNMVMAGDGHSNIYNINSLEYPQGSLSDVPKIASAVNSSIRNSKDKDFQFGVADNNAQGKFDMIFTNPPFGANVEVDPEIASKYELNKIANSKAPEVLFIEACYNFLKPGGKMGIVLPDGILGNPNMEKVRIWILQHFKLLASIDLPVETFLPQVGVQASLLFLQKKTAQEELISFEEENYDVFMAVVDKVGKDRRGVPIFKKDDDGAELLFDENRQWITSDGKVRQRNIRIKKVDDDLPDIVKAYKDFIRN